MKIDITFKTPDAVDNALADEPDLLMDQERADSVREFLSNWVRHGEYVKIVFDTEAKTATVWPVKGN